MLMLTCWAFWYKPVIFGVKTGSGITKLARLNQTVTELGLREEWVWIVVRVGNHQNPQVDSPPSLTEVDLYGEAALPMMRPQANSPRFGEDLSTLEMKTIRQPESDSLREGRSVCLC